eukprot:366113-Chlamydomonas_euryale.AAC.22
MPQPAPLLLPPGTRVLAPTVVSTCTAFLARLHPLLPSWMPTGTLGAEPECLQGVATPAVTPPAADAPLP